MEIKKRFEHVRLAIQNKESSQLPLGEPLDMNPSQLDHLAKPFNSGSVIARTENATKTEASQQHNLTSALNDRFNNIKIPAKTEIAKMQFGESKMQLPSLPNLDVRPKIIHRPIEESEPQTASDSTKRSAEEPSVVKKKKIEEHIVQPFEDPKTVQDRNVNEDYDE
eukprot:NODE_251_length_12882_cov_0.075334.p7 type:complete len:166 gc:universal NODE_251_length_12882_cov_0.075334:7994-7497(-)